jgi:hypothetical protein
MPNLNFLVFLNAYEDANPSNNPSLNNFKWDRQISGLAVNNPTSHAFTLAPGETRSLFNGMRTLNQDNTTQYSISQVPLSSNSYLLSAVAGTLPNFRTPRSIGIDATTQITATQNGPLITFTGPSIAPTTATFTGQVAGMTTNVTIADNVPGTAGNSVLLTGDGISSLNQLIVAWNTANPMNLITLQAGDDTQVPNSGAMIALTGGSDGASPIVTSSIQIGDQVVLGNLFSPQNQSVQTIIAKSATSFTVANELGVAEGPITLGSGFASQVQIYSAAGVQVGDTIDIQGGFSAVTQGFYKVTAVTANTLTFYSTAVLPIEGPITTEAIVIYSMAKQLVYMESDQDCTVNLNSGNTADIHPFVINNSTQPGVFMNTSTIWSISVTNNSVNTANLFIASAE